ncbi:flagellar protein FlaG [Paenibacillus cremeus]|nr:flagellar protein FlaG [Paenibacillus cremeus]
MKLNVSGVSSEGVKELHTNTTKSSTASETPVSENMTSIKEVKEAQLEGKSIPVSEEQVVKAIERAIKAMEGTSTTLEFSIHEKTKHIMVKVLNKENGEVIREIPNEKTLDFLAKLWETAGIIIDKRR